MIMHFVLIGCVIIIITLLVASINMYKKLIRYENWTLDIRKEIYKVFNTMKILDNNQMFEKDDDVGRLWEAIKSTIDKIDDFVVPDGIEGENENEDKEFIIE
jgi:hypothetical protein